MAGIQWTPEELAEMAAADTEIDAQPVTKEEVAESNRRDAKIKLHRKDNRAFKLADYQRRYYEANKEKLAESKRRYREANKDKVADYQRRYYEANKDKVAESKRRYYEANKDKVADYQRRYREAKKKGEAAHDVSGDHGER